MKVGTERRGVCHLQKDYFEALASQLLLHTYPEKYKDSYLSDRPDIQNEKADIGVEVTFGIREKVMFEYEHTFRSIDKNDETMPLDKESIAILEEDSADALPYEVFGSHNNIRRAYLAKMLKLNDGGYKIFKENNLFIIVEFEGDSEIQQAIQRLEDLIENKSGDIHEFDYVYVYTGNELYTINTKELTYSELVITADVKKQSREKAKELSAKKL